jgi:guanyl-specific ribonuclease Sa
MKPARSGLRRLVPVLIVLAGVLFGRARGTETRATEPRLPAAPVAVRPDAQPAPTPATSAAERTLDLHAVETPDHRDQIQRVVEAMDRTGAPPAGVAQGGRRGGQKGVFQNAEGRLPRQPRGYWIESDVWPKNGPRDAERLIFGREREVYWTRDHYETFVRLR